MPDIKKIKLGDIMYNIKDEAAYVKPSTGIPQSDLDHSTQTTLTTINDLLTSDDATVDTIREVLDVFAAYPEETTIVNALAGKAAVDHSHVLTPTNTTVVTAINPGSGSFTPTTKYLHATTTSAAPNSHSHTVTVSGTTSANSGNAITAVTSVGTLNGGSGDLTVATTASAGDIAYVESVTHTAASLTGTTTFNTDAIKDVTLSASTAATAGPEYVESISGSAPALTGTKTFVTAQGSFSGGEGSLTSNDTTAGGIPYLTASYDSTSNKLTLTTKYLHHTHAAATLSAASTGTVGISGGSYSATTKYMAHSNTEASTDTVGISGGSITPTTKYLHHTHTGASLSGTTTDSVAPSGHTHSYGSSAALTTTANNGSAVDAITDLTVNSTASAGDIAYIESATHTHSGASVKSSETVVKTVTID